jgi:hypothetical protein
MLIDKVKPKVIVEVGCWKGQSTVSMLEASKDSKIYCIDTWLGAVEFYTKQTPDRDLMKLHGYPQVYYQFLSNIVTTGHIERVEPMPMTSRMGAELCPIGDLIYIDASHEYKDVKEDLEGYYLKLNKGGIMFGDDYYNVDFPGVKQAVDEFAIEKGLKLTVFDSWFWIFE